MADLFDEAGLKIKPTVSEPPDLYGESEQRLVKKDLFDEGKFVLPSLALQEKTISDVRDIYGPAESAVNEALLGFSTGFLSLIPAGYEGIRKTITEGPEAGAERIGEVSEALTYKPREEKGQIILEKITYPFEKLQEGIQAVAGVAARQQESLMPILPPNAPVSLMESFAKEQTKRGAITQAMVETQINAVLFLPFLGGKKPGLKTQDSVVKATEIAEIPRVVERELVIRNTNPADLLEPTGKEPSYLKTEKPVTAADDLFGGKNASQQAILDANIARQKKIDESLPVESGEGDLFSGRAKQVDIEDITKPKKSSTIKDEPDFLKAIADLGGLSRAEAKAQGIDPAYFKEARYFRLFPKKKGMTFDQAAEALSEKGYPVLNAEGRYDPNVLLDKLSDGLSGKKIYSERGAPKTYEETYQDYLEQTYGPRPGAGATLYSGIPIEEVAKSVALANRNIRDGLGIPEKGVQIVKPEVSKEPGLLTPFKSPSQVEKKFPIVREYRLEGEQAVLSQDTLRAAFGKRISEMEKSLKGSKENKALFNEITLTGDFEGVRFSAKELKERFGAPPEVIKAYNLDRSAFDHALGIANKVRELRDKPPVNRREGYVPHYFHNFFVIADGNIITSAKTLREATSIGNKLRRQGQEVLIKPKQFEFPGEATQASVMGDGAFFNLKGKLEDAFSLTPEEATQLLEGIARLKGRSRFVGNFMERKGVKGFEADLDWARRHYFNMISRYAALDGFKSKAISRFERQFDSFDKQHTGIAQYIKNYINDVNGVPTGVENLLNSTLANTPIFSKFLGKYLGDRPSLQIASATTNAVAIAKLGLYNTSAAFVNASQEIMLQAILNPKWYGVGKIRTAAVIKGLAQRKIGLEDIARTDIGILKKAGVNVAQGLESGAGYSKVAQMGQLFRASTAFFRGVEFNLRATAVLGGYYKGLSRGMSRADALEFAKDINRRVNFDYSIADTPSFIRRSGPVGQVLFQFKKFPIKAMEFMVNLKGWEVPSFWIPFVLFTGYFAFPGMDAIRNMARGAFGIDIELESKKYLLDWAKDDPQKLAVAKTIFYGAFGNEVLGNVDISRRVGGGDFIPSEIKDVFGPFFSSTVRATQMAAQGEWAEFVRAIVTSPGNILIAIQNEGELTSVSDRDRLIVKLDPTERVLKALGFRTTKESLETDRARIIRNEIMKYNELQREAIDDLLEASKSGDPEAMKEAAQRVKELRIPITEQSLLNEAIQKKLSPSMRAFLRAPDVVKEKTKYIVLKNRQDLFDEALQPSEVVP